MKDFSMFCLSLYAEHLNNLKKINYIPVGLGINNFNNEVVTVISNNSNIKDNITKDSIVILCDTLFIYEEDPETGELDLKLDIYCDTVVVDW